MILFVVVVREDDILRENANQRVMIATEDGGHESASDYDEETLALITHEEHGGDDSDHEDRKSVV